MNVKFNLFLPFILIENIVKYLNDKKKLNF